MGLGFEAGVVAVGVVDVVAVVAADDDGADEDVVPVLPLVTTKVTTRMSAPRAAMIAGRGSSIRGVFGTVRSTQLSLYCVFGT